MKKTLAILLTLILTFSCFGILGVGTVSAEEQTTGQEIIKSDFKADYEKGSTNWVSTLPTSNHVEIKNEADEYFARVSNGGKAHGGMYSTPFEIVPNNEYEFSFYFRIPKQTRADGYTISNIHYQPAFGLFEVTTNADKTAVIPKVPDVDNNANNTLYAYSGSEVKRRTTFETNWTIELPDNTVKFQRTANSSINYLGPDEYKNIVSEKDATEVYTDWTKFTVKFKGLADEADETSQTAAFVFNFLNLGNAEIYFDIKDVSLVCTKNAKDANKTTLVESDFKADYEKGSTNWVSTLPTSNHVEIKNEADEYFARVSNGGKAHGGMYSTPFEIVPNNEYEFSFYFRIPKQTRADGYTISNIHYQPAFGLFEVTTNADKTAVIPKVPDVDNNANNTLYAYSGSEVKRRTTFETNWTIELPDNTVKFQRTANSSINYLGPDEYKNIVSEKDATEVYTDWTKFTVKFKGLADEADETSQTAAFVFNFLNVGNTEIYFDIKDVKLVETKSEAPVAPPYKEPVAPEGAIYYESFEDDTDDSVAAFVQNASTVKLSDTDYASGYKALAISSANKYLFIPIDTTNFTPGTTYEFSMDWKLPSGGQITQLMFVGYNGETLDSKFAKSSNVYTYKANSNYSGKTIDGTDKWQNLTLRFGNSNYTDHNQYGILLRYTSGTLYLDNLAVAPAKEETVKGVTLTEEERTEDTIKVLAFGNSFSNDSVAWLSHIAKADGKDLRVANCVIGGCSLQRHYSNIFNGSSDKYNFTYYTKAHGVKTYSKASMQEALMATDWDYITLQQASGESYKSDTYEPYLTELITYIKTFHPNVKILFNETWAYPDESHMFIGQSVFDTDGDGNSEEAPMFEKVREAYLKASQNHGFTPLIPVGEAILRARDELDRNLSRDGHHLDDRGRLIAALMWYEMFTGVSALDNKVDLTDNSTFVFSYSTTEITGASDINGYNGVEYKGTGLNITAEEQQIMKTIAHETVELYKKTNKTQKAIEAIGEVNAESGEAIETAEALRAELDNDILLPNLQTLLDARAAYDSLVPEEFIGDFDGTGVVDLEDVNLLARHFAGWDSDLDEAVLDLNSDGVQNLKDLVLLAQYVAGWDVSID